MTCPRQICMLQFLLVVLISASTSTCLRITVNPAVGAQLCSSNAANPTCASLSAAVAIWDGTSNLTISLIAGNHSLSHDVELRAVNSSSAAPWVRLIGAGRTATRILCNGYRLATAIDIQLTLQDLTAHGASNTAVCYAFNYDAQVDVIELDGVAFEACQGEYAGAVLVVSDPGFTTSTEQLALRIAVTNSVFDRCVSTGDGGGALHVFTQDAPPGSLSVAVTNSSFQRCEAAVFNGGAIDITMFASEELHAYSVSVTVQGSNFSHCSAYSFGGSLSILTQPAPTGSLLVNVNDCNFIHGYTINESGQGGAINVEHIPLANDDLRLMRAHELRITNSTFTNLTSISGGAIEYAPIMYGYRNSHVYLSGLRFEKCSASSGSALEVFMATEVIDSTFTLLHSVFLDCPLRLQPFDCKSQQESLTDSEEGSAVTLWSVYSTNYTVTLASNSFTRVGSSQTGGGLFFFTRRADALVLQVEQTIFSDAHALFHGGAVSIVADVLVNSLVSVTHTTMLGNCAHAGAALAISFINSTRSVFSIYNCTFDGNIAATKGAGLSVGCMQFKDISATDAMPVRCTWDSSAVRIKSSRFQNGEAYIGAAVQIDLEDTDFLPSDSDSSFISFDGVTMTSNQAAQHGGAVTILAPTRAFKPLDMQVEFVNTTFAYNTADLDGGSLYVQGLLNVSLTDSTLTADASLASMLSVASAYHLSILSTQVNTFPGEHKSWVPIHLDTQFQDLQGLTLSGFDSSCTVIAKSLTWKDALIIGSRSNILSEDWAITSASFSKNVASFRCSLCDQATYATGVSVLRVHDDAQQLCWYNMSQCVTHIESQRCDACPHSAECNNGQTVTSTTGYWRCAKRDGNTTEYEMYHCPGHFCLADNKCAAHHDDDYESNVRCGKCATGYARMGEECVSTSGMGGAYWLLWVIINWFMLLLLLMSMRYKVISKAKILLYFFQVLPLLISLNKIGHYDYLTAIFSLSIAAKIPLVTTTPAYLLIQLVNPLMFFVYLGLTLAIFKVFARDSEEPDSTSTFFQRLTSAAVPMEAVHKEHTTHRFSLLDRISPYFYFCVYEGPEDEEEKHASDHHGHGSFKRRTFRASVRNSAKASTKVNKQVRLSRSQIESRAYHLRKTWIPFRCLMLLIHATYETLTETALELIDCVPGCQLGNVVEEYPDMQCSGAQYTGFKAVAICILAILSFGFPLILLVFLIRNKKVLWSSSTFLAKFGVFYDHYRPRIFWWQVQEYVRRLILMLGYVLLADMHTRDYFIAVVSMFIMIFHVLVLPFEHGLDNFLEAVSLMVLTYAALNRVSDIAFDGLLVALLWITIVLLIGVCALEILELFGGKGLRSLRSRIHIFSETNLPGGAAPISVRVADASSESGTSDWLQTIAEEDEQDFINNTPIKDRLQVIDTEPIAARSATSYPRTAMNQTDTVVRQPAETSQAPTRSVSFTSPTNLTLSGHAYLHVSDV